MPTAIGCRVGFDLIQHVSTNRSASGMRRVPITSFMKGIFRVSGSLRSIRAKARTKGLRRCVPSCCTRATCHSPWSGHNRGAALRDCGYLRDGAVSAIRTISIGRVPRTIVRPTGPARFLSRSQLDLAQHCWLARGRSAGGYRCAYCRLLWILALSRSHFKLRNAVVMQNDDALVNAKRLDMI